MTISRLCLKNAKIRNLIVGGMQMREKEAQKRQMNYDTNVALKHCTKTKKNNLVFNLITMHF